MKHITKIGRSLLILEIYAQIHGISSLIVKAALYKQEGR